MADKLPTVLVLRMPENIVSCGIFKSLLYEHARFYGREGQPKGEAQFNAIADSARLVDLDAMYHPKAEGGSVNAGYNAALREIAGHA